VEELLVNEKTGYERVVGIYTDSSVVLKFENISYASFVGKNITIRGPVDVVDDEVTAALPSA